ncbi:GNAT family N-acetyltransferase [Amycolatopsis tucumanensis]|uniref:N-acetyltransferase domain-containing protein n=1 Tax=Amycolatopsis tucumanensis TaxID=401106 RepID=A0ABP7JQ37_9PSEU|nr:GNAT family N-acetyltransferase [Amycolatopsis tucumanensis]MCF6424957.1 GNAT family N-acetyltransferase [Amycolatopsis tucumanensis]
MRLRADWLSRVLTVPYVPVLGPAHPDLCTPEMFIDVFTEVLTASRTGVALPFDKDRRWSPTKDDTVLMDEIVHRPDHTIIPVVTRRGGGTVKTYFYGDSPDLDALRAATRRCCTTYAAAHGRVMWFSTNPTGHANQTRVLVKDFNHPAPEPTTDPAVTELDDCDRDVAATFADFAAAMADHGFEFLHNRRDAGHQDGPILVTQAGGRVVGAIGPLTIISDRSGRRMLLPQYFGVLPGQRGHGHGRALWRAVERWSVHHRAHYQLLQTRVDGASDRLFLSEGLRPLGYASTVHA